MAKAKIAGRAPKDMDLDEGRNYAWCSCGLSANQPMCDGAHGGCGLKPLVFKCEEAGTKWLCTCKQTRTPPYCDGTHSSLPADVTELEPPTT
tara:strand:- start:232 stop:507 length:276 start_codon:yes stop_codon:yes gene_type:complete